MDINNKHVNHNSETIKTPKALVNDYRFLRLLGEGTSGKTYLAECRQDQRHVAVKVLKTDTSFKNMELFDREAQALMKIDVSGVPKFYNYVKPDNSYGEAYLIQEYIDLPSLQSYIDEGIIFPEQKVIRIMSRIAAIIKSLQTEYTPAIIHRDIKPSNILYDNNLSGCCHLIDFGSVASPLKKTMGSTVAGTMGFMAPEQLMGDCAIQSDYYALGATALNLLTGISPVDMEHDQKDPFKLNFKSYLPKSVSPKMVSLLERLLSPDMTQRPKNAIELTALIEDVREHIDALYLRNMHSKNCFISMIQMVFKIQMRSLLHPSLWFITAGYALLLKLYEIMGFWEFLSILWIVGSIAVILIFLVYMYIGSFVSSMKDAVKEYNSSGRVVMISAFLACVIASAFQYFMKSEFAFFRFFDIVPIVMIMGFAVTLFKNIHRKLLTHFRKIKVYVTNKAVRKTTTFYHGYFKDSSGVYRRYMFADKDIVMKSESGLYGLKSDMNVDIIDEHLCIDTTGISKENMMMPTE